MYGNWNTSCFAEPRKSVWKFVWRSEPVLHYAWWSTLCMPRFRFTQNEMQSAPRFQVGYLTSISTNFMLKTIFETTLFFECSKIVLRECRCLLWNSWACSEMFRHKLIHTLWSQVINGWNYVIHLVCMQYTLCPLKLMPMNIHYTWTWTYNASDRRKEEEIHRCTMAPNIPQANFCQVHWRFCRGELLKFMKCCKNRFKLNWTIILISFICYFCMFCSSIMFCFKLNNMKLLHRITRRCFFFLKIFLD